MLREYLKQIPGAVEAVRFMQHPRATAARWRAFEEFRRAHGAAVSYLPPDLGHRGTLLIVNPLGDWVPAVLQEGFFIKAAQLAGYDIAVVTNRGAWVNRYHRLFGVQRFLDLDDVVARARQMVDPHVAPSLLAGVRTFHDLLHLEYRGVHVGQLVASTFVRRRYEGDVACEDPAVRQAIMGPLQASLVTVHAAETMFDSIRPHVALFNERAYSPYGEFFSTAIRRGVPAVQWCGSHRESAFMLKRYHAGNIGDHPASISAATWSQFARRPWYRDDAQRIRDELGEQYETGRWFSEVGTQFRAQGAEPGRIRELLRLDPHRKIAAVFSHMFWDATFFFGDDLFMNYREWFMETVRAACRNDRVQWILKLHPANMVKLARDGYHGELVERQAIRDAVGALPPHVHILDPDVPLSTWSLLAAVDYAVTVRGTVGIEAALFGIPVLTAGTGRYDRHGFTVDSTSRVEYLNRLARIEDIPRLTAEQVERAEKFAYATFCLRPCRVSSIQYVHRRDAAATLDVTYHVHTPDELLRAHDFAAVSEWMRGDAEDFLMPEARTAFDSMVAIPPQAMPRGV